MLNYSVNICWAYSLHQLVYSHSHSLQAPQAFQLKNCKFLDCNFHNRGNRATSPGGHEGSGNLANGLFTFSRFLFNNFRGERNISTMVEIYPGITCFHLGHLFNQLFWLPSQEVEQQLKLNMDTMRVKRRRMQWTACMQVSKSIFELNLHMWWHIKSLD